MLTGAVRRLPIVGFDFAASVGVLASFGRLTGFSLPLGITLGLLAVGRLLRLSIGLAFAGFLASGSMGVALGELLSNFVQLLSGLRDVQGTFRRDR